MESKNSATNELIYKTGTDSDAEYKFIITKEEVTGQYYHLGDPSIKMVLRAGGSCIHRKMANQARMKKALGQ